MNLNAKFGVVALLVAGLIGVLVAMFDSSEGARPTRKMKLRDFLGLVCSISVGIVGLTFASPPKLVVGFCSWSEVFPIYGPLWPNARFETYDGCQSGPVYTIGLVGYLSVVFFVAGALASRIAATPSPLRGACVNAVLMAATLLNLTLIAQDGFAVLPTLVVGVSSIAGAAYVGFLGGPRAKSRP